MNLIYSDNNLFDFSTDCALVQCISLDCKMGAGIAKTFVENYPIMKPFLLKKIRTNNYTVPITLDYKDFKENRYILNLITKKFYYQKPTYEMLRATLEQLRYLCIKNNITKLGMPKIGCGLDKLNWLKVEEMILDIFKDININIVVSIWKG